MDKLLFLTLLTTITVTLGIPSDKNYKLQLLTENGRVTLVCNDIRTDSNTIYNTVCKPYYDIDKYESSIKTTKTFYSGLGLNRSDAIDERTSTKKNFKFHNIISFDNTSTYIFGGVIDTITFEKQSKKNNIFNKNKFKKLTVYVKNEDTIQNKFDFLICRSQKNARDSRFLYKCKKFNEQNKKPEIPVITLHSINYEIINGQKKQLTI